MQNLRLKIKGDGATRIRELPLSRFIPNMITISAICSGFSSIKFAISGDLMIAMVCILMAVVLDGTDGRVARFLGKESHFGAELDSLADFLDFGVAPGIIVYVISLKDMGNLGWGLALFATLCCGLRLARFNTLKFYDDSAEEQEPKPEFETNYSVGVAAPAGAMIVLAPAFLSLATGDKEFLNSVYFALTTMLGGILMASKLRTFVFKKVKITPRRAPIWILMFCLTLISLVTALWMTISVIILAYLISIPISDKMYWKKVKAFNETAV